MPSPIHSRDGSIRIASMSDQDAGLEADFITSLGVVGGEQRVAIGVPSSIAEDSSADEPTETWLENWRCAADVAQ